MTIQMQDRTFGRLLVLDLHSKVGTGEKRWNCLCECGNYSVVRGYALRSGHTTSCGCRRREQAATNVKSQLRWPHKRMDAALRRRAVQFDLARQRAFGRLRPFESIDRGGREWWLCTCTCGKEVTVRANAVRMGNTRSCGCLRDEITARIKRDETRRIEEWRQKVAARTVRAPT
jgi:hypothetical protein